jgi:hypothetical protein
LEPLSDDVEEVEDAKTGDFCSTTTTLPILEDKLLVCVLNDEFVKRSTFPTSLGVIGPLEKKLNALVQSTDEMAGDAAMGGLDEISDGLVVTENEGR